MDPRHARRKCDRLVIGGDRIAQHPPLGEDVAKVAVSIGVVGLQRNRPLVVGDGRGQVTACGINIAEIIMGSGKARIEFERLCKRDPGLVTFALRRQR